MVREQVQKFIHTRTNMYRVLIKDVKETLLCIDTLGHESIHNTEMTFRNEIKNGS